MCAFFSVCLFVETLKQAKLGFSNELNCNFIAAISLSFTHCFSMCACICSFFNFMLSFIFQRIYRLIAVKFLKIIYNNGCFHNNQNKCGIEASKLKKKWNTKKCFWIWINSSWVSTFVCLVKYCLNPIFELSWTQTHSCIADWWFGGKTQTAVHILRKNMSIDKIVNWQNF